MTSRKFSRKRIGQALGLIVVGLALGAFGSVGYGGLPMAVSQIQTDDMEADSSTLIGCKVKVMKGDVSIKRVGDDLWRELKPNERVGAGDEIITHRNSWVVIQCGCVQVSINTDSYVKLEDVSEVGGEGRVIYGVSLSKGRAVTADEHDRRGEGRGRESLTLFYWVSACVRFGSPGKT